MCWRKRTRFYTPAPLLLVFQLWGGDLPHIPHILSPHTPPSFNLHPSTHLTQVSVALDTHAHTHTYTWSMCVVCVIARYGWMWNKFEFECEIKKTMVTYVPGVLLDLVDHTASSNQSKSNRTTSQCRYASSLFVRMGGAMTIPFQPSNIMREIIWHSQCSWSHLILHLTKAQRFNMILSLGVFISSGHGTEDVGGRAG